LLRRDVKWTRNALVRPTPSASLTINPADWRSTATAFLSLLAAIQSALKKESRMGVFTRKDSPYYWLWMDGTTIRENTKIRVNAPTEAMRREARRLAEDVYHVRLGDLVRDRMTRKTVVPTILPPLRKATKGWCYIYVVQVGGRIKIGRTTNVEKRLETLRTGNADQVSLLAAAPGHVSIERLIHDRFAYCRFNGEWYSPEPELITFIRLLANGRNPVALLWDQLAPIIDDTNGNSDSRQTHEA
jgi:hypothetical protein